MNVGERRLHWLDLSDLEKRGEGDLLVCQVGSGKDGVTADIGALQETKHDIARGLDFVADILMPQGGRGALVQEPRNLLLVSITVDDVETGVVANRPRNRLVVRLSEMPHEFLLNGRPLVNQILIRERNDLALRNEQREFVLLRVVQLVQLHTVQEGADSRLDVLLPGGAAEQVGHGLVCAESRVFILEWPQRVKPHLVPCREVLGIPSAQLVFLVDIDIGDVDVVADGLFRLVAVDRLDGFD